MFSVEHRDALRAYVLGLAKEDERVVAGAAVGSLVLGGGDDFSDLDLTFGVADGVAVDQVLEDWTRRLVDERGAVHLADLTRGRTIYRVLLMPDALQFDLSMTPAAHFRPAGPRWRTLFGEVAADAPATPTPPPGQIGIPTHITPGDLLGWGVVYALHVRSCIERGRLWQAEHYANAVRDHALALACLREGVIAVQARGYDDLSPGTLARFDHTHVPTLSAGPLRVALAASVGALLWEGAEAHLPDIDVVAGRLAELL